jgi:hypothetical protein
MRSTKLKEGYIPNHILISDLNTIKFEVELLFILDWRQ